MIILVHCFVLAARYIESTKGSLIDKVPWVTVLLTEHKLDKNNSIIFENNNKIINFLLEKEWR